MTGGFRELRLYCGCGSDYPSRIVGCCPADARWGYASSAGQICSDLLPAAGAYQSAEHIHQTPCARCLFGYSPQICLSSFPARQTVARIFDTQGKQPVKCQTRLLILNCGRALGICHQASAPASGSWMQCRDRIAPITLAEIVIFDSPSVFGFLVCC